MLSLPACGFDTLYPRTAFVITYQKKRIATFFCSQVVDPFFKILQFRTEKYNFVHFSETEINQTTIVLIIVITKALYRMNHPISSILDGPLCWK